MHVQTGIDMLCRTKENNGWHEKFPVECNEKYALIEGLEQFEARYCGCSDDDFSNGLETLC